MTLEILEARIRKVRWHGTGKFSPSGSLFLIAETEEGSLIKGEMQKPSLGEPYRFFGERRTDPKYDNNEYFRFYSFELLVDRTVDGLTDYLAKHVRRLGPVLARRLVQQFNEDTLTVLRTEPEQALAVPGITPGIVAAIKSHFEEQGDYDPSAYAALHTLFGDYRVPQRTMQMLLRHWGSDAPTRVRENPYMLLSYPRMGWKTVDQIALDRCGYSPVGIFRQMAAVVECLEQEANEGHTYALKADLEFAVHKLIGKVPSVDAWRGLEELGVVTYHPLLLDGPAGKSQTIPTYSITKYWLAEQEIAYRLRAIAAAADHPSLPYDLEGLEEEQIPAAKLLESHGVAILTGPPGSGKTHSVTKILTSFDRETLSQTLVIAPTGKAAKRAAELIERHFLGAGVTCSTCHRALKLIPNEAPEGVPAEDAKFGRGRDEFGFGHDHSNPLPYRVVIMEETSMTDAQLLASVLRAIAPGTRLTFVGDENQLPSVRPGAVLRDMIAGGVPTARLTKPRRNAGRIAQACYEILRGRTPRPATRLNLDPAVKDNWIHLEERDPNKAAALIVELHRRTKRDPFWDLQVVTPEKNRKALACSNLNTLLSRLLNPRASSTDGTAGGTEPDEDVGPGIAIGDKVVRTKNGMVELMVPATREDIESGRLDSTADEWDWDDFTDDEEFDMCEWRDSVYRLEATPVVNGDVGRVEDVVKVRNASYAIVRFTSPDRLCRIAWGEHHLILAYAMTCHKCVHPDTIVETEWGLMPIREIPSSGFIGCPAGPERFTNKQSYPIATNLRFATEDGYSITVTHDHQMDAWSADSGYMMQFARDLRQGQWMRLRLGVTIDPCEPARMPPEPEIDVRAKEYNIPAFMTLELAEFLGLMVADGSVWDKGFRLAKRHPEVVERFGSLCRSLFGVEPRPIEYEGATGYECSSTQLAAWFRSIGGMEPNAKDIPNCVLRSPIQYQRAFLRGLFEDGTALMRTEHTLDCLEFSSVYPTLRAKVRIMLLRCGIIIGVTANRPQVMYLYGANAAKFARDIGFITPEKQRRAELAIDGEKRYRIPVLKTEILPLRQFLGLGCWTLARYQHALNRQYLSRQTARDLLSEKLLPKAFLDLLTDRLGYHHVRITSITTTESESMCVEVPNGHRFLQNGFPHGNSQGSGFPYVVVPVHSCFYSGLLTREWLYTAMSRAEDVLVTVGEYSAIEEAVKRKTVHKRKTRLAEFIRLTPNTERNADEND